MRTPFKADFQKIKWISGADFSFVIGNFRHEASCDFAKRDDGRFVVDAGDERP